MSPEVSVPDDVKDIIKDVIVKHKLDPKSNVKYETGSEAGENYSSKTVAVSINNREGSLDLFVKYALNSKSPEMFLVNSYMNEIFFYEVIYPAYSKFAEECNEKDCFRNVPKCHATSTKHVIALENLKSRGMELHDRKKVMNESHIVAVLEAFAKYHAISFAFKDQKKDTFEKFVNGIVDIYAQEQGKESGIIKGFQSLMNAFLTQLDPVKDKHLLRRCGNVVADITEYLQNTDKSSDSYSVILKGDCWSNNIMFKYEDKNKEKPVDVMLIDWQWLRLGSVVADLSYFFYTVASKEDLDKLTYYMKIYYEELAGQIRKLGGDPTILYPYSIFEKEWIQHCKYGYSMAVIILNIMLMSKEDAPDLESMDTKNFLKVNPGYINRLKTLTAHFIEHDFI